MITWAWWGSRSTVVVSQALGGSAERLAHRIKTDQRRPAALSQHLVHEPRDVLCVVQFVKAET